MPYALAKKLAKSPLGLRAIKIHPLDATEAEIARRCGVRPAAPTKVAAQLVASDLDAVMSEMSDEQLAFLARRFGESAIQRQHVAAQSGASSGGGGHTGILTTATGRGGTR